MNDPDYANISIRLVHNNTNRQYAVDVHHQFFKVINNLKFRVSVEVQLKESNSRIHFVNQTLDFCNILSNGARNWQLKAIIGDLSKHPNLPKACPINPGHYFIKNFTTDIKQIPLKVIPESKTFGSFEMFTVVKKRSITIANIKADAELKYNEL